MSLPQYVRRQPFLLIAGISALAITRLRAGIQRIEDAAMRGELRLASGCAAAMLPLATLAALVSTQEFADAVSRTPEVERGAQLFETCAACHGVAGAGTEDGLAPRIAGDWQRGDRRARFGSLWSAVSVLPWTGGRRRCRATRAPDCRLALRVFAATDARCDRESASELPTRACAAAQRPGA